MTSNGSTRYKRNLKALSRRHPHVREILDTPPSLPMSIRIGSSGFPNLYFKDSRGGQQPLYPETDPTAGLRQALAQMKEIRGRIVCHYGFGLGFHAVEIVRSLASANIVVLFEAHPAVFKSALVHADLVDVLSHPNVRMVVGEPVDFFKFLSGDPEEMFASLPHIAIRFDRAVALAPAWYGQVSNAMATYNNYHIETQSTLAAAGLSFIKNRFRNLMVMSRSVSMKETAGMLSGIPAVIVASGPSLAKNIDGLTSLKGKALLVALDSAVGPLVEKGIAPDLVVSADHRSFTYEKLAPFKDSLRDAGLVFMDHGAFNIPNYLPFKRRFFTFSGSMYLDFFNRILEAGIDDPVEQSQSVLHPAVHFVRQAGCDPIIFTGLDLAFDHQGRDHAEGTLLHWGNQMAANEKTPMVEDVNGRPVPTHVGFLNMLTTCGKMIRETPDRTWVDATEGGAKIPGTEIMSLASAIQRYCHRTVEIASIFNLPPVAASAGRMSKNLAACRKEIHACLERIDDFFNHTAKMDDYLSKKGLPENGVAGLPENMRTLLGRIEYISSIPEDMALRKILADFITGPRLDTVRENRAKQLAARVSKGKADVFICAYEQLKVSQVIWREGFSYILKLLDAESEVFGTIEKLKEESPKADATSMALAKAYFKYDCLWLAEQCLGNISSSTEAGDFYLGAVRLKQGDVLAGLELMRAPAQKDAVLRGEMEQIVRGVESEWLSGEGPPTVQTIFRKRLIRMGASESVLETLWPKDAAAMDRILSETSITMERLEQVGAILSDWEPAKERLPEWWVIKARQLSVQGLPVEGLSALERAFQMEEGKNPRWMALSARLLIEAGRANEGIARLDEAVAMDPQTAVLWEEIGDALMAGNDFNGALAAYEKCMTALPDRAEIFRRIGDCFTSAGQPEAARTAYERAEKMEITPGGNKNREGG